MIDLADRVAVEVMGWNLKHAPSGRPYWENSAGDFACLYHDWQPDVQWRYAGMVLDRMRELGWYWRLATIGDSLDGAGFCQLVKYPQIVERIGDDPPKAACLAALAASVSMVRLRDGGGTGRSEGVH